MSISGAPGRAGGARYNHPVMGSVDYRMARRALLRAVQRGKVSIYDVCDAHPELVRAARFLGEETRDRCPICRRRGLRVVLYTYGSKQKRENGRVRRRDEIRDLRERLDEFCCYMVEVCTGCNWNHLVRSFVAGRRHAV